jgi:hypothetical protein
VYSHATGVAAASRSLQASLEAVGTASLSAAEPHDPTLQLATAVSGALWGSLTHAQGAERAVIHDSPVSLSSRYHDRHGGADDADEDDLEGSSSSIVGVSQAVLAMDVEA